MAQFSRTWWGQRFIQALEEFSDEARLGRGRGYARNGKVKEHQIANGKITAQVRGSVNPYFGVYNPHSAVLRAIKIIRNVEQGEDSSGDKHR